MSKEQFKTEKAETANRLREKRINSKISQEEMAEILDVSVSTYKKIEGARSQMTIDELRRLNRGLNISIDYLLFGEREGLDGVWERFMNCSESDKFYIMLKAINYFMNVKRERHVGIEEQEVYDEAIRKFLKENLRDKK